MKRSIAFAVVCCVTASAALAQAGQHPRLLVGADDVARIRARVQQEPYASMVKAIERQSQQATDQTGKSVLYDDRAIDLAALFVLTGDRRHAAAAEKIVLAMVNDKEFWNNPGSKGLTRAGGAMRAALAFDLCAEAWPEATRTLVSQKLRLAAEGMMKSMGRGANNSIANNWQAVRYGAAGLAFLASDEPGGEAGAKQAYGKLKQHLSANLGDNGWNPEGIGYTQYPWQFTGPFGIAAQRAGIGDLRKEVKKAAATFWTTYAGTVAIPYPDGMGIRADLSDDHPSWSGDATTGLAFWYAPPETAAGLKWMYNYLTGPRGEKSWGSHGAGGLYSVLYYPSDLAEKNPADVPALGLNYTDKSHGIAIFRNAYRDENDIVALLNAHSRQPSGCHGGADTNTIRLIGLGGCWIVGSGRTGNTAGQTNLFAGSPPSKAPGGLGKLEACTFDASGGGVAVASGSCMGTQDHRRAFGVDYSGASGAPAVLVSAETSGNGKVWRLNTPEFNTVKTTANGFAITGPTGSVLTVRVIEPATVTFRTGTFERGGGAGHAGYRYRDKKYINNTWIEFDCDRNVLVVMTLTPKGAAAPAITGSGTATAAQIKVGTQAITVKDGAITFGN